ncbi:hypothetical protein [Paraburkholderia bannensis]|uniref:hypothetical protein n=1 Tax=Paraburkholderia bannensis TaxID=765414 RepID=UPI002AB77AF1|nr:hypothetical protein [Paraburkholderia bannensis]
MKILLSAGLRLFVMCLALYALLVAITLVLFPLPGRSAPFDTASAGATVFQTEAKYFVMNRAAIGTPGKHVVFLGASNTVGGFPVALTQAQLPDAVVSNAALSGSNLTQIHEAFQLTRRAIKPADRAHTVYVIGLWYGLFVNDRLHWPHVQGQPQQTAIDTELYRYDFYRRAAGGPVAVLPEKLIPFATIAIYPVIALEKIVRVVTGPVREAWLGAQPGRTDQQRDEYVASAQDMHDETAYWHTFFPSGAVDAQQFAVLDALVTQARADGSAVVLVNLPIPAWHSAAVSYDGDYQTRLHALIARHAGDPLVSTVSMRDMNTDSWFCDEVHPKPHIIPLWVSRIAAPVNAVVARVDERASAPAAQTHQAAAGAARRLGTHTDVAIVDVAGAKP